MAQAVKLSNGKEWKSKTDAKQHFKSILHQYDNGDVINLSEDHEDLSSLVERLDMLVGEGPSKIGAGIAHFERRLNSGDGWSSPGFWIFRTDTTETDFSYLKAIDGKPKPRSQEFYDACHNAVSRDLLKFKQHQFDHFSDDDGKIECDVTGMKVLFADASLNHADPLFGSIVNKFRETRGWTRLIPEDVLTVSADKQLSTHFSNPIDEDEFRQLHHSSAVLRIVAKVRPPKSLAAPVKRPLKLRP